MTEEVTMVALGELGYFVIGTRDAAAWKDFAEDVLGVQAVPAPHGLWLRMDEWAQRATIIEGDHDRLIALGWTVRSHDDFAPLRARIEAAGASTQDGTAAECRQREVSEFFWFQDPAGNRHEIFRGRMMAGTPFRSPIAGYDFVTGRLGAGHAVLAANGKFAETVAFWDAVGVLRLTDYEYKDGTDTTPARRTHFYRCNRRHHSVAYSEFPAPSFGCHHIMVELTTIDAVGMAADRAVARGDIVASTLGRHTNDEMISVYLQTPAGFAVEIGTDARLIEDDHEPSNYAVANSWGHHWQRPWMDHFMKALDEARGV